MLQIQFLSSIKIKFMLMLMIAGAISMIISMIVINQHSQEVLTQLTESSIVENANTREGMLNDFIEFVEDEARYLASHPTTVQFLEEMVDGSDSVSDETFQAAGRNLSGLQKMFWGKLHHLFFVDTQGNVVLNVPSSGWSKKIYDNPAIMREMQGPHEGENISENPYFELGLVDTTVSGFFSFQEQDHYHQLVLSPVRDVYGDVLGVVVVEVSIEHVQSMLQDGFAFGKTGSLYLSTKDGQRVVHSVSDKQSMHYKSAGIAEASKTSDPVVGWYKDEDENTVLGVYHASSIYPWTICVEVDREEVLAPVYAQQSLLFRVLMIGLVLFAGIVYFIGSKFWNPLKEIVASTNRVADGDLWHEIPITRNDEIGQLESAVDSMRGSLKNQIDHLDSQIAERTQELEWMSDQFKHNAEHDDLTDLVNRKVLEAHLEEELGRYKDDPNHLISVLFFDFDRFKIVNDSLGHSAGDALLCSIADRFRSELRDTDLPARFGGDEFVVVLSPVESVEHAHQAADRLLKLFEEPHNIDGHRIVSTASIGLVIADPRYENADGMIRDADSAMYEAKLAGKGQVINFDEQMLEDAKRRMRIEEDLCVAIENNEIFVVYQPIISLDDMSVAGFEALIRWNHPELGLIRPDEFIPVSEDTGQIVELGAWILKESCEQISKWDKEFGLDKTHSINVNVAKRQLIHPEFIDTVKETLERTGLAPHRLKIEITESTAIDPRHDMSEVIRSIRDLGVLIAMDDFGTGHSSLSLLHKFDFDILKIDQSFVRGMEESREMSAVLHAIISLAQNTGMVVVAEGTETKEQVACLISHSCDLVQGYYFAKPLIANEAGEFLRESLNNDEEDRKAA